MSAGLWWRSWCFRWSLGGDEVLVADRWVADGELEDPVEQQAAAAGAAPVEAEHELVHVAGQVGGFRRALMGAQQPPLDQRGDPVDCGEQRAGIFSAGVGVPLAAPVVDVAELVQPAR